MSAEINVDSPAPPLTRLTPGRRVLLLTLLAFVLPLIIGGSLYWSGWRPGRTANHGQLITPPKPVPIAALGQETTGKWLLVVAGEAPCTAECIAWLRYTRSIQISLGREISRLRRVALVGTETAELKALRAEQPDLIMLNPTPEWAEALSPGPSHRVFLVDPAGYLMMQYAPGAEPKGIRADLERLLKYSWIG